MVKIIFAERGEIPQVYEALLNDRSPGEFSAIGTQNGGSVSGLIEEEKPDVVMIGTELLDGPGLSFLAGIRKSYPDMPVILSVVCPDDLRDPRARFATHVWEKSYRIDSLENVIAEALHR